MYQENFKRYGPLKHLQLTIDTKFDHGPYCADSRESLGKRSHDRLTRKKKNDQKRQLSVKQCRSRVLVSLEGTKSRSLCAVETGVESVPAMDHGHEVDEMTSSIHHDAARCQTLHNGKRGTN